jgi:hypothetical protein
MVEEKPLRRRSVLTARRALPAARSATAVSAACVSASGVAIPISTHGRR